MARPTARGNTILSSKHQLIDRASTYLVVASAIATVIVVFSIFASIKLFGIIEYQNKVKGHREEALKILKQNKENVDKLKAQYIAFDSANESIVGTSEKNSKIVLDALPSKYDFPAYITSINNLIVSAGLGVESIDGEDKVLEAKSSELLPNPVDMPFELEAKGDYAGVQKLIDLMQRSIRPFKITTFDIEAESSEGNQLTVTLKGISYYQPTREVGINEEVVKSDKEFGKSTEQQPANTTSDGSTGNTTSGSSQSGGTN